MRCSGWRGRHDMLTVLDLFSGACGGWSLGLHRAGLRTIAACEIDEWRRRQYAQNNPDVRLYDDIQTLTAERLRADGCWPIDLVCGSPPCQDASSANTKGRGIDGERTGLYMEAVRLVIEIRPRWAAFENVPGIRNRGIDRVLGELEAADYACWPFVVGALDVGAPHIRKRSWVVCADAATVRRLALPWDQPDGDRGEPSAQPDEAERWPQHQACDGDGQYGDARREEGAGGFTGGAAAAADAEGIQKRPGPDLAQSELEGRIAVRLGPIAETWNGGIAGRFGMDAWVSEALADLDLARNGDGESLWRTQQRLSQLRYARSVGAALTDGGLVAALRTAPAFSRASSVLSPAPIVSKSQPEADAPSGRRSNASPPANAADQQGDSTSTTGTRTGQTTNRPTSKRSAQPAIPDIISPTLRGIMAGSLPRGWAQPLLAAYGDSILPQISEIIGRAIMQADGVS